MAESHWPILNAIEMLNRTQEYLRQTREHAHLWLQDPQKAELQQTEAQRQYALWFQARGVMLIFPKEGEE